MITQFSEMYGWSNDDTVNYFSKNIDFLLNLGRYLKEEHIKGRVEVMQNVSK